MISRLLSVSVLVLLLSSLAVRGTEPPPRVVLPPDEYTPLKVLLAQEFASDEDVEDYSIGNLNVPAAWKTYDGKGQIVAVLDTGASKTHRDLRDQIAYYKDFTNEGDGDLNGHGTWCAAQVAGAKNKWGMIGVAPGAKLWIGKVLAGRQGSGQVDWIAAAIRAAVDWRGPSGERVSVISMSLGGSTRDSWLPPAIAYARSKGVIVVAAAGNAGPSENTVGYPGGYPDVVCVAAHDVNDRTASFSSRGSAVFVSGPGVNTRAAFPGPGDGYFAPLSGTSMSTPAIAGLAALWCGTNGGAFDESRGPRFAEALKAACTPLVIGAGRTTLAGWGKPDAAKLVAGGTPVDPPTPMPSLVLTEADLNPAGILKLRAGGLEKLRLELTPKK